MVGLPAVEILDAATLHAARALGVDDRTGTIEPGGRAADLIAVRGDPRADISVLNHLELMVERAVPSPVPRRTATIGQPGLPPATPPRERGAPSRDRRPRRARWPPAAAAPMARSPEALGARHHRRRRPRRPRQPGMAPAGEGPGRARGVGPRPKSMGRGPAVRGCAARGGGSDGCGSRPPGPGESPRRGPAPLVAGDGTGWVGGPELTGTRRSSNVIEASSGGDHGVLPAGVAR